MPRVLISDELSEAAVEILERRGIDVDFRPGLAAAEVLGVIGAYDGLAVRSATQVTGDLIAAAEKLRVIGRAGIGVDNIDVAAATARGIVVMNTPFGNSITTAEHTIAMMFAAARQIAAVLAEKGTLSLDAPVSGGDVGARNATLTVMIGGPNEALEKVLPVLQAMGKTITHVGEAGAGQIAKAANQIMVAAQMVAMGELLVFAQKAGADPRKVVDAIKSGAAQCWTLDVKPPRLFSGNRAPGFKAYMQAKDLAIVLETAREYGIPLPSAAVDAQLYNAMLEMGMAELDNSAVLGVIEGLAGTTLLDEL